MKNTEISHSCQFVQNQTDFASLVDILHAAKSFALDTESNSFHVYYEQVCLIQLSTREEDYAVDPFIVDVRSLGRLLEDPEVEVVVHAADYDIRSLQRDYGFRWRRLFDTMLAAKLLGRNEVGLAALVRNYFGVDLTKEHQRSDWGRRPLSHDQLAYAFTDTRYLLPLKDLLSQEIIRAGREEEARKIFEKQAGCEFRPKLFDVQGYQKLKGFRGLNFKEREIVRALYLLREDCARASNLPPFKVFGNEAMVELAKRQPLNCEELKKVKGLGSSTVRRDGESIVSIIIEARERQVIKATH